jgi:hypothetical protein
MQLLFGMFSPRDKKPPLMALCTMLTGGDHAAGTLLANLLAIDKPPDIWIVVDPAWWMRTCCFTSDQLDQSISKLVTAGLVERIDWSSAGMQMLCLTPATNTRSYIAKATTWDRALRGLAPAPMN